MKVQCAICYVAMGSKMYGFAHTSLF